MSAQPLPNSHLGAAIVGVDGREILDSRGFPTVQARVFLENGISATAAAPSGASTGAGEAVELRDGDKRLQGRGKRQAAAHLSGDIAAALRGVDAHAQEEVDDALIAADGTPNKSRLGANALLAASLAAAKAGAKSARLPLYKHLGDGASLPAPMLNIINGGAHATNSLDVQEFMIMPLGFGDFETALFASTEVFHALKSDLDQKGLATAVGDEGGFAPDLRGAEEALDMLCGAIARAGFEPGREFHLALDCAAGELYEDGIYRMPGENFSGNAEAMVELLHSWRRRYPIASIEDGCADDDWEGWRMLTARLGNDTQIVGDDLFVTDSNLLRKGAEMGAANALLLKPNQAGTLTEARQAAQAAKNAGYGVVASHRSGETESTDLADLAVAWNVGQIKTGAPCRGERTAKYNRLLRIADDLGDAGSYAGTNHPAVRQKGSEQ